MKRKIFYFEIGENFDEYKKIQNTVSCKTINKIIAFINKYKFKIMTRFNLIQRVDEEDKIIYIIYRIKNSEEKIIKKINKKIINILREEPKANILLSRQIKKFLESEENKKLQEENCKNNKKSHEKNNILPILEYYQNNKELYLDYIEEILNSIIKLKKEIPEEQSIYILIKSNQTQYINIVMHMLSNYKMINIVTPNTDTFKRIEYNLEDSLETITILNNKRKSLSRAKYIVNMDFKEEEIVQYSINRTAIIFNTYSTKININNFDGTIINNIRIKAKDYEKFDLQDEYVVNMNNNEKILNRIENNEYDLIGNNGIIDFVTFT